MIAHLPFCRGLNGTYDAAEETFELPGRWPSICKAAVRRRWPRRALLAAGCAHGRPKEKTSMQIESLRDMYIAELQELASVERQMVECLGQVAARASNPTLKNTLSNRREQTEVQGQRLNTILHKHSANPAGHIDQTMQALIYETERMLPMLKNGELRDAGLIGSLQRLKHYEIAAYGSALARQLRLPDDEKMLRETLDEEKETDASLTVLAESEVNHDARAA
jgi:ferritin-like metal-binding protein YciE